jgi:hypothetical protein
LDPIEIFTESTAVVGHLRIARLTTVSPINSCRYGFDDDDDNDDDEEGDDGLPLLLIPGYIELRDSSECFPVNAFEEHQHRVLSTISTFTRPSLKRAFGIAGNPLNSTDSYTYSL